MSLTLNAQELAELTGRTRRVEYSQLKREEWLHFGSQPEHFDGLTADDWFHKEHARFLYDLEDIAASLSPYTLGVGPSGEGIYFLFVNDQLSYVGQSKRIDRRLFRHKMQRKPFTHYAALWVPLCFLDTVESFYIALFQPPINDLYPEIHGPAAQYLERIPDEEQ